MSILVVPCLAELLPRDAGCLFIFGHVAENAARAVCTELVQVAPVVERPTSLDHLLVSSTTLALGALLRLRPRHPRSAAVLSSGMLGLYAFVAHGSTIHFVCAADKGENGLMDIAEAKAKLEDILAELAEAGFSVWGWDDESIQIGQLSGPSVACAPRHVSLDVRRDIDGTPKEVREGRERL